MHLLDDNNTFVVDDSDDDKKYPADPDHDHNPFTGDHEALEREEDDLARFVTEEAPEDRIGSLVETLREEYRRDTNAARAMLNVIYEDLASSGVIPDPEEEKREILRRLATLAEEEETEEWG